MKLCVHDKLPRFLNGESIYPINIEISPVGFCNANCSWCFYKGNYDKDILDFDVLAEFLRECSYRGVKAISWTGGGEPTLHPKFSELVDVAHSFGLKQGMFTNALNPITYDPTKFDWIRISKTDKPFDKENLAVLRSCKSIGLSVNYLSDDEVVVESLIVADEVGVDYVQCRPTLKTRGCKTSYDMPKIKHPKLIITEYKFNESSQDRQYDKCFGYHFVPFIWHSGDYSVCGYHKGNPNFTIGNIYTDSLFQIVGRLSECVGVIDTCQTCCKNHEINKLINDLKQIDDPCFV